MNMRSYLCVGCHKTFYAIKGGAVCPYCRKFNPDILGLVESGVKILGKILSKK